MCSNRPLQKQVVDRVCTFMHFKGEMGEEISVLVFPSQSYSEIPKLPPINLFSRCWLF